MSNRCMRFVDCVSRNASQRLTSPSGLCLVQTNDRITNGTHVRLYHEKVIDHYEKPRNVGSLDKNDQSVGTGLVGAPACGDVMKLQIKVDKNGRIIDAKFKTFGCASAIASSSLATEWVKGKTIDEAGQLKNTDIAKELCLPPVKLHCSMLAEDAIQAALKDYRVKLSASNASQDIQESNNDTDGETSLPRAKKALKQ